MDMSRRTERRWRVKEREEGLLKTEKKKQWKNEMEKRERERERELLTRD